LCVRQIQGFIGLAKSRVLPNTRLYFHTPATLKGYNWCCPIYRTVEANLRLPHWSR
jgi:hypothetical protein